MIGNRQILIPLFVLIIGVLGCGLFSGETGGDEAVFAPTEVGTPEGDKITKDIGPAGGTLASPDGRMTLTVPQGALTETVPFSIQPITNKAGNGIGLAYRLEPDGRTFATPLEITVRYDEKDLEGTVPEALLLAYQDQQGAWHEQETLSLTGDTLTVATTHFTDWSFLSKMRIEPAKATVGVGKTLDLVLIGCVQKELTNVDRFRRMVFGKDEPGEPEKMCNFGTVAKVGFGWYVDIGTIGDGTNPVVYTAPPKKPTPNVATVAFPYDLLVDNFPRPGPSTVKKGMFTSKITIVDRGYRATGGTADVKYSGTICSLEKPFKVIGTYPSFTASFEFVPSSATAGTASYRETPGVQISTGTGTYTIEGSDTDSPKIVWSVSMNTIVPGVGSHSAGGTAPIQLVPLYTDECN